MMRTTVYRSCRVLVIALLWWFTYISSAAAAEPMAYVANEKSDDVSVIDTATNSVVRTIAVGKRPRGVAILRLCLCCVRSIRARSRFVTVPSVSALSSIRCTPSWPFSSRAASRSVNWPDAMP